MARSFEVNVNPTILLWARTTMNKKIPDVARRLNVSENLVQKWELSEKNPTLNQVRNLSKYYKRPLAAFFLPEPPKELPPPRDFRDRLSGNDGSLLPETILAIRRARRMQSVMWELATTREDTAPIREYDANLGDDPDRIAENIRELLGISIHEQDESRSDFCLLDCCKSALESLGILVFQLPMEMTDARAFSLTDGGAPVIVLNKRDSLCNRMISLFHELAHILLGKGGICDMRRDDITPEQEITITEQRNVEIFCNRFAEAVLTPKKIDEKRELNKLERKKGENGGRKNRARECVDECGIPFISTVLNCYKEDRITYCDVSDYLEIKVKHIPEVERLIETQ